MIKIKLENPDTNEKSEWFDLLIGNGTKEAHEHLYSTLREIYNNYDDCIITDIESDWARFDDYTALDDVVDTVRVLVTMFTDEMTIFKTLYKEGIHEPLDIANKVRYHDFKYYDDVTEDDEVWETVYFEKEKVTYAILEV
ncbi:hypothetical protein GCM10022378_00190 [Salinicoccus jeotgali]|uniref:Uncharacterized protein n=1 Tax=Salinicoccus jeotgali TaxID=381634 RepID=A0ABP7E232_9STAP